MHGRSLELCCLSGGEAGGSWAAVGHRCREREPPCDQQPPAGGPGKKGGFPSQLKALLVTDRRLCLKSHQLVTVLGVTLEMSMASWQGLKQSSAYLWWSLNILLFTGSKNKLCFPRAGNPACRKRQVFPNCFPYGRYLWFI